MRVIAGIAKGRNLTAPRGLNTRPITAQIKESLFNIWQGQIEDSSFLDLFAGSGSMGIEAKSRGAAKVVFVEKSSQAVQIIKRNLVTCGFSAGCYIYQDDVLRRISKLNDEKQVFDIIYLDPPFTVAGIFLPTMAALSTADILSLDGTIAIRTPQAMELPDEIGTIIKYREKHYGISQVHFYKKLI